ncbi:molybdopterin molybdotransferase MoeA [Chondromyces apiculatus]|uniref:Molybdopterin molybdenumtransferase n=1 Tax=Chondromyces apiculatus DSM 436 TaxID=1192034 RepID=A0A017SYQ9_9BACT|nr:gephyrin-like molybdotransferase Glp [Chondromyces apiculatus]EYF02063.1 Molybdopterin biosynthesis protein MoeA [Chondromyces apiculatus DSM 436]
MIPFEQALTQLLASARPLGAERVSLDDAAGRVLAEDIVAPDALPPFDHSSMDGYALASADLTGPPPHSLPVRGESAAGGPLPSLDPGAACRIFTGARLPDGADTIVPQEDTERAGDTLTLRDTPKPGTWIRRRGADLDAGTVALSRGTRLTPGKVALAAALDRPQLLVARRPLLTLLCSGDELRSPGIPGPKGSIPESNGYFVAAAARAAGAIVRIAPFVPDDAAAAIAAAAEALRGADLVVTIGGVSVGDRDVMRPALEAAGVTLDFWRVAIKPGKPLCVGRAATPSGAPVHVLGLPGNPASAALTFTLFGLPLLRALQGDAAALPPRLSVRVAGTPTGTPAGVLRRQPGRAEFLRARLDVDTSDGSHAGELVARILPNQASGAVTSFAEADALVLVPAEHDRVDDGARLWAIRLTDA